MKEVVIGAMLAACGWFGVTLHGVSVNAAANNERINELVKDVDSLGKDIDTIKEELIPVKEYASR